jgi:hypothetical protein
LLPDHQRLLAASGISAEVARERGYVSVDTAARLKPAGFTKSQRSAPGLLIPVHGTDGQRRTNQYRPDTPRLDRDGRPVRYETPWRAHLCLDVPPRARAHLRDPAEPLWITEGARKADAAVTAGLCCIAVLGVNGWLRDGRALPDWDDVALRGREVIVCFDSDVMTKDSVRDALKRLTRWLDYRGAAVRHAILPPAADGAKTGLDDYLAAGHTAASLRALAHEPLSDCLNGRSNIPGTPPEPLPEPPSPVTLAQVEKVYAQYLHDEDKVTTRVVHAVYVANLLLDGDPVWVFLVGGSGQGKTERLTPLAGLRKRLPAQPHVIFASALSGEAALLSATPRRDRADHASGGLLREIGERGMLVIKDFTSILEMDRTARGQVLAALREVYDGRWDRPVGADGGQVLHWAGKCGLLAGCTTAIDKAHSVMNDMGPRSLFVRLPAANLDQLAGSALDHMGHEGKMRAELAAATAGLLANLPGEPHKVDQGVRAALIAVASLVSQARSPVHRDWGGEIDLVGDAEAPTRIVKQLGQIWRACGMLGLDRAGSWEVVRRCALDSIPKLRGAVIRYLAGRDAAMLTGADPASTTQVAIGVVHPSRTVRRALEDLAAHGVVTRESAGKGRADIWGLSSRARAWTSSAETFARNVGPP